MQTNKSYRNNQPGFLCLPADFKNETLLEFDLLNKKYQKFQIKEVYGNLVNTLFGSGRRTESIPDVTIEKFADYVRACKNFGINFNYTLNPLTLNNQEFVKEGEQKILDLVYKIHRLGINDLTITLPSVVDIVSKNFPNIKITLSVINNIKTIFEISSFEKLGAIHRAYLSEDLNRDLETIRNITKNAKLNLAVILNNFCFLNCPFRAHHYNYIAQKNVKERLIIEKDYYRIACARLKTSEKEIIRTPWIRPEEIDIYRSVGIKYFKIAGREMIEKNANFAKTAEFYMSEKYDGNLIDLLMNFSDMSFNQAISLNNRDMDGFFQILFSKSDGCNRNKCDKCLLCDKYSNYVKIDKSIIRQYIKYLTS